MASETDELVASDFDESFEEFLNRLEADNSSQFPDLEYFADTPVISDLQSETDGRAVASGVSDTLDSIGGAADDVGTNIDTSLHVRLALQGQTQDIPKPIWETGIWGVVFGQDDFLEAYKTFGSECKRPTVFPDRSQETQMASSSAKKQKVSKGYASVVKFKPDIAWQEQQDAFFQSALKLWYIVVCRWDEACAFRIQLHDLYMEEGALQMLSDIFSGKSAHTLQKRVLAVMKMCDYADQLGVSFPWGESDMYNFICSERNGGAPVSRLKGFMQAVTFCRYVLEVQGLQPILNSARCKGATKAKTVKERVQASPLKVGELQKLHQILNNAGHIWDRIFSGAVLFCTYARARWGDLMRASAVIPDFDKRGKLCYLEARVGQHKTMHAQQHRHLFLPMVAPSVGVDNSNWSSKWIEVRKAVGLSFDEEARVMPAPRPDGSAGIRPLETPEAAAWLRLLLQGSSELSGERRISSHSMKSTILSYAAKRGVDIHLRLQLGYHSSPYKMGLTYSRDGAAASLMAMEQLLGEIRTGYFDPDNTRSGRLNPSAPQSLEVIEIKDENTEQDGVPEVAIDDSYSSDSSSSSDGSNVDEPAYDFSKAPKVFLPPAAPDGFHLWQHSKLKTLHLMDDENRRAFVCGRVAGPNHLKDGIKARYDTPVCSSCFTRAAKDH